jgi:hypothetical protein
MHRFLHDFKRFTVISTSIGTNVKEDLYGDGNAQDTQHLKLSSLICTDSDTSFSPRSRLQNLPKLTCDA